MDYKKGERVKHPTKAEWGIGEVLEDSISNVVRVFFAQAGEKKLSLKFVQPVKVKGVEAEDEVLDTLRQGKGDTFEVSEEVQQRAATTTPSRSKTIKAVEEDEESMDWDDGDSDDFDNDDFDSDDDYDDM